MQDEEVSTTQTVTHDSGLKQQLEEMQNVCAQLNNEKFELIEQLIMQKNTSKELEERVAQQEKELHKLKNQLSNREQQLKNLEQTFNMKTFQHHQIVDRMRHYEAQSQLTKVLQEDLTKAQARIDMLLTQNSELQMALAHQGEDMIKSTNEFPTDKETIKKNELIVSLSASVKQLQTERDYLLHQLKNQKSQRETDMIPKRDYEPSKHFHKQLEEKFKKTMDQIAELTERKQQLEHLVTQLQGESDTIADYVALYQVQRGIMKTEGAEKDEYIAQLSKDWKSIKAKLSELQSLIFQLLEEREQIQNNSLHTLPDNNYHGPTVLEIKKCQSKDVPKCTEKDCNTLKKVDGINIHKSDNQTAKKIIDLFTELESSNLTQNPVLDTFHPCSVCSGRLLTV